jgi:ADP-heptose:LPS heptosyltransferase
MRTTEWFPERFAEVVRAIPPGFEVIQLGGTDEPLLPGVRDLRARTGLREAAAILHASELFIGLVGLLMHLARAVDCPGVIVYGGRERPDQSGYAANLNLARSPECSPCWLWNTCDHAMKCMDAIPASEVIAAVRHRLGQPRGPLAVGVADLSVQPSAQCGSP